jgi:hypothetical protein
MRRALYLGDGPANAKPRLVIDGIPPTDEIYTIDLDPSRKPHLMWDLNNLPWPLDDNSFEECHAYEVLEHLGTQGDAAAFFGQMYEIWRVLKNGGLFFASFPLLTSPWLLAEPSHTRVLAQHTFNFLDQDFYSQEEEKETCASDFRYLWKGHFDWVYAAKADEQNTQFILMKAIKEGSDCLSELLDIDVKK